MEAWSAVLLLLLIAAAASATTTTADQVTNFYCLSNTTYTANSTFSTSLQTALSSLSAASAAAKFSNTTVSSAVYALYFCRYDLPLSACHECVSNATDYIVSFCPAQTEAVIWYEHCTLRYGTAPLNRLESPYFWQWGTSKVLLEVAGFNTTLDSTLRETVDRAVKGSASPAMRYFATGEGVYGRNQRVRCLVQCPPDISAADCGICLSDALNMTETYCFGAEWGMVFKSNCMMRFGVAPFYSLGNSSDGSAASPTGSTSAGSGSSTGASVSSASSLVARSQRYGVVAVGIRRVISGALLLLFII